MIIPLSIINFTPDSFSDGGKFFSEQKVLSRVRYLKKFGIKHFDIGAQSTAPFNSDIGEPEEIQRLDRLFTSEFIKELVGMNLSIDSFRPAVIEFVLQRLESCHLGSFTWNDISGKVDSFVGSFLQRSENNYYVLCHNLVPSRDRACDHMQFVVDKPSGAFLVDVIDYFSTHLNKYANDFSDQIIIDSCFGFSKSTEQNYYLIKNHHKLEKAFPSIKNWMIGISRKSFLKRALFDCQIPSGEDASYSDAELAALEIHVVNKFFNRDCNFYIRTHVPENFAIFNKFDMILDT